MQFVQYCIVEVLRVQTVSEWWEVLQRVHHVAEVR